MISKTDKNSNFLHFISKDGWIAALAIISIFTYLLIIFTLPSLQAFANYPLYIALTIGGGILIFDLLKHAWAFEFGADLIAGVSIITAVLLGEYLAGTLVVLMLSGGQSIENFAIRTASKVLEALAKRAPTIAHRKQKDLIEDVAVEEIAVDDLITIFPHEICPVDGEVLEGNGTMDESYLTGEPFLLPKAPGSNVLAGSINGDASLTIKATRLAANSQYAKIMQVMSETQQKRPYLRRLADELGAKFTPIAMLIAILAWYLSGDPVRFLAVLVIATPCPLLIGIPVAIIGSISLCARRGIMIKDPIVLEQMDQCQTMIFDKTGTLTYGEPCLTDQTMYAEYDVDTLLKLVASVERYSKHPLASAIHKMAVEHKITLADAKQIKETKGEGLYGVVNGYEINITSRKRLAHFGLEDHISRLPEGMGLECVILINGKLAAHYRFRDTPRADSRSFVHHLMPYHGIKKVMIVSGDRAEEVNYLAEYVGISEVDASKSPEEKVKIVVEETKKAKTAYLGDGINDAPALLAATVGIAFGRNSDITAEAAGAVIMDSTFETVDEFLHISRRMHRVALQSAIGGMVLSIIGMLIAAFGFLPPVAGAISQEIIDILAILNALRTIWRPSVISDIPASTNKSSIKLVEPPLGG